MKDSIAGLSLDDEEEEIIQLEVEETNQEISYVNYLVGVFLTSSVVHFQAMRSTLVLLLTSWEILPGNFVNGKSGDLSLGWNSDCKITLRSFSRRYIDVMIGGENLEMYGVLQSTKGEYV
ncbi:hypothetical protein J1N35_037776 [Gossypium stocksii]|uniref:Uncharacterized protein n=1 Tax=Gossypium stocksii TaxID=47602 RepID=A0A9D3UKN4_9ROSI|nr:hypothetical protein J1N35_037776 [Gossypium stocksii]